MNSRSADIEFLRRFYEETSDRVWNIDLKEIGEKILKGDKEAAYQLAEAHLHFLCKVCYEFLGCGLPAEDLVNEGWLGLLHAAERYDYRKGPFIPYARYWITNKIQCLLYKLRDYPRLSLAKESIKTKVAAIDREHAYTDDELADIVGTGMGTIRLIRSALQNKMPINEIVNDSTTKLEALLSDDQILLPDKEAEKNELINLLGYLVYYLPPREREVLCSLYGVYEYEKKTYAEIAKEQNCPEQSIRKITRRALEHLRQIIKDYESGKIE